MSSKRTVTDAALLSEQRENGEVGVPEKEEKISFEMKENSDEKVAGRETPRF